MQTGSAVSDGTLLPLFKFRSIRGGIVFKNGGPLGWISERQERTSAEINATSATSKKVVDSSNLCVFRFRISINNQLLSTMTMKPVSNNGLTTRP
jgi:hypothetical protein